MRIIRVRRIGIGGGTVELGSAPLEDGFFGTQTCDGLGTPTGEGFGDSPTGDTLDDPPPPVKTGLRSLP